MVAARRTSRCPRPLQENTSAPAGPLTADRRRAQPQLPAQILVGGPRVAGVQAYDLAGRHDRARR